MLGCSISKFSKDEEARGAGCERVKHGGGVMSQPCVPPSFHSAPRVTGGTGVETVAVDVMVVVNADEAVAVALAIGSTPPKLASPTSAKHHHCY